MKLHKQPFLYNICNTFTDMTHRQGPSQPCRTDQPQHIYKLQPCFGTTNQPNHLLYCSDVSDGAADVAHGGAANQPSNMVYCSDVSDGAADVAHGGAAVGDLTRVPLLCLPRPCGADGTHPVCGSSAGLHDGVGGVHCHCSDLGSHLHGGWHLQRSCHR